MVLLLISFFTILVSMLAMAIGVMFGRGRIRGSCGGPGKERCRVCDGGCAEG